MVGGIFMENQENLLDWPIYWNSNRLKKYVLGKSERLTARINELSEANELNELQQIELNDKYGRRSFYQLITELGWEICEKEELMINLNHSINRNLIRNEIFPYLEKSTDKTASYDAYVDECADFASICDVFYD
jgi:hypothetical protein